MHHEEYFKKVKPIPLSKGRSPEMTAGEVSQLRGLLGSLQWPAVQSSPHIQCSTSLISGSMSAGLVKSIVDANKLLRFCKENAVLGQSMSPWDQSVDFGWFACSMLLSVCDGIHRRLILLVPQETFEGQEMPYHLIDWKSSKLTRIARSSLGAESQAAASRRCRGFLLSVLGAFAEAEPRTEVSHEEQSPAAGDDY